MDGIPVADKPAGQFQATRWSMVLAARDRKTPEGEAALAWLCERYWHPLRTWARAKGLTPEDAEDLVQDFFEKAVCGDLVGNVDASRGRFRSWMLRCLENHWTDLRRRQTAQKRGGGATMVPLDAPPSEANATAEIATAGRTPEQEYDFAWACAVMERATIRLGEECDADGHTGRFAILRVFFDGERGELPLAVAAEQLGLSLPALKSAVHRLRQRMGDLVRDEICETLQEFADVEAELHELVAALRH